MPKRRRVVSVRVGDAARGGYVWGYGVKFIARLSELTDQQVREAMTQARGREPKLDPADPVEVVAWSLAQRGHKRLANAVRRALSGGA